MDQWGGRRYLWHQMLADRGILVASVDNRGTGARGRDFEKQTYLKLGQLESADQRAARRQLASRPWVDGERTGIWGWSYGGYLTLMSLLTGDGGFAAGVSVAPVTHWELYDTIYTERYMWTPDGNPEGYRKGAPLNFADSLGARLLLVHGTGDDNVHFQNTVRMVDALERADRQFSLRIYPNAEHGIGGTTLQVNLFRMITDHLRDSLTER
jgi:dipeptidyl-peptidase-4